MLWYAFVVKRYFSFSFHTRLLERSAFRLRHTEGLLDPVSFASVTTLLGSKMSSWRRSSFRPYKKSAKGICCLPKYISLKLAAGGLSASLSLVFIPSRLLATRCRFSSWLHSWEHRLWESPVFLASSGSPEAPSAKETRRRIMERETVITINKPIKYLN